MNAGRIVYGSLVTFWMTSLQVGGEVCTTLECAALVTVGGSFLQIRQAHRRDSYPLLATNQELMNHEVAAPTARAKAATVLSQERRGDDRAHSTRTTKSTRKLGTQPRRHEHGHGSHESAFNAKQVGFTSSRSAPAIVDSQRRSQGILAKCYATATSKRTLSTLVPAFIIFLLEVIFQIFVYHLSI